jgi:hypothetical protein
MVSVNQEINSIIEFEANLKIRKTFNILQKKL